LVPDEGAGGERECGRTRANIAWTPVSGDSTRR
jgi:hypothetical protein